MHFVQVMRLAGRTALDVTAQSPPQLSAISLPPPFPSFFSPVPFSHPPETGLARLRTGAAIRHTPAAREKSRLQSTRRLRESQ